MDELSENFKKFDTARHAKELEEYCKPRGLCVRETALGRSKKLMEDPKNLEEAMRWCSVALYEARCELGLMKK